jgi:heme O synthase-like polyprenyltransferase
LRFVIGLVVIGAALAIAARVAMNGAPQPATDDAERDRELPRMRFERKQPPVVTTVIGPDRVLPTPWWVRARAFVVLSFLLALLGAVLALVLVLGGVLVVTGLKNAVQ